jgi:hypothetical protein
MGDFVRMFTAGASAYRPGTLLDIEGSLTIGSHTFDLAHRRRLPERNLFSAAKDRSWW